MSVPDDPELPRDPAIALPTDTTPTWEIELLISGALAFASLQLPGIFDEWFISWVPRLAESLGLAVTMAYVFLKSLATLLAITFGLHILLRGFWAAALGLNSVYPDGIAWDRIKSGPIFKRETRARIAPLPVFISRLDNTASIIFALGAVLLLLTGLSSAGVGAGMAVVVVAARLLHVTVNPAVVAGIVFAVFATPVLVGSFVDRRMGERLAPDSRLARVLTRLARVNLHFSGSGVIGPMLLVFTSRLGQVRGTIVVVALLYGVFGVVLVQAINLLGLIELNGYQYLAATGPDVASPEFYADQREGRLKYATAPFLPSEVLHDGVVRLFVPYRIARFDGVLERDCPAAVQATKSRDSVARRAAPRSVIECLSERLAVEFDGAPVVGGDWRIGTDAASSQRGLVLHFPVTEVDNGRHRISLRRLRRPAGAAGAAGAAVADTSESRTEISFWLDRDVRP